MDFLKKYMTTIKLFTIIFIFINSTSFTQSKMFWNVIDMPFHQLISRFGVPTGLEYQKNGEYWMAYDYGNKSVVYVVDKAFVSSILYLEKVDTYDDAKKSFIKWDSLSTADGFIISDKAILFFQKNRHSIQLKAKLIEQFDGFFIAIEIKKI